MRAGSRPLSSPGGAWVSNVARAASSHQPWARLPGGPMALSTARQAHACCVWGDSLLGSDSWGRCRDFGMRGTGMVGIDIERGLNEAWFDVASFVPKIAVFLVIRPIADVVEMGPASR